VASFVSAKRLFRGLSKSNSKLVKHRAQSAVREFMSAVWPSIAEGFPSNSQLCFMVHFLNFARSFGVYNFLRGKASVYVEIKLLRKEIILLWMYERKEILIRCKQKRFSLTPLFTRNVLSGSKRSCNVIISIRQRHLLFHSLTRKLSNGYIFC